MGTNSLVYTVDDLNNRIIDFSYAGYMGGGVVLPTLPNKVVLSAIAGDNTAAIQAAINTVSALTADVHGFRGAVFLNPGNYEVDGTLNIATSGVVLRGAGNSTILTFPGTDRQVINIQGASGITGSGTTFHFTDTYVPVGATSFNLDSTSGLAAGNLLLFHRPWTQTWIDAMTMTAYWAVKTGPGFERTITAINGTTVTVDTQLPTPFELTYLTGTCQKATDSGRISNCGVESMMLVSTFTPPNDIADAAVQMNNCKNCWAKNLTCSNFGNGYVVNGSGKFVTIQDCVYTNGYNNGSARPFAFDCNGQYVLFQRCVGVSGFAHIVATQDSTPGPNVFLNITAQGTNQFDGGPHQRWAFSALFDNVGGTISELKIYNATSEGSGHGWVCGHSILYNCTPLTVICQMPTLDHNYNYLMGGTGTVESTATQGQNGVYVSPGTILNPKSLYLQQLKERLGTSAMQNIGYPRFTGNQKILAMNSSKFISVTGSSTTDNAAVVQLPYSSIASQQWQMVDIGSGYYEIKSTNSGKALAVFGNSNSANASIVQNTYTTAGDSGQWQIIDTTNGFSKIINRASGKALEISGNSTADNATLDQNTYTGAANQQFQIVSLP